MATNRSAGADRDTAGRFVGGERHWAWKGDEASDHTKRLRARRWYSVPTSCEACGAADRRIERHHSDGDPGNNEPSNIWFLCRACHQRIDGREQQNIERLAAYNLPQGPKPCANCGRSYKPLRHGRCGSCAQRWRKSGRELDTASTRKHQLGGHSRWVVERGDVHP